MGGISNEREVSFKSGRSVAQGLRQAGHNVMLMDANTRSLNLLDSIQPHVAFVALHGLWGEDGGVQRILEQKGIPYTGSGPEASLAGMDKVMTKRAFIRHGVPTADYIVVPAGQDGEETAELALALGFPLVCKPACGGSSIGVSIVHKPEELPDALEAAFRDAPATRTQTQPNVLLEGYVQGREFTVGVLGEEALPVVEVRTRRAFFDYEAKYHDEGTEYIVPAPIPEDTWRNAQEAAVDAFHALGCRHFARVDMMSGVDGRLYVLEVNTIPGFTPRSLLPMAAKHAGIEFPHLCEQIIRMALGMAGAEMTIRDIAQARRKRFTA